MTTFIPRLLVAVVPFILLVAGIALAAGRRQPQPRRQVLRRRTSRSVQRALAVGMHLR